MTSTFQGIGNKEYKLESENLIVDIDGIENWDTQKVQFMYGVFQDSAIQVLDLSNWDLSNVEIIEDNDVFQNMKQLFMITVNATMPSQIINSLSAPLGNYIPGADGKWYQSDGTAYEPQRLPGLKEDTYYAVKILNGI